MWIAYHRSSAVTGTTTTASVPFIKSIQRYELVIAARRVPHVLVVAIVVAEQRQQIVAVGQLQRILQRRSGPDRRRIIIAWKVVVCSGTGINKQKKKKGAN